MMDKPTRYDILGMKAGPELDALVAIWVMKLMVAPNHVCGLMGYGLPYDPPCPACEWHKTNKATWRGEDYSKAPSAMMDVIKEMNAKGFWWEGKVLSSYSRAAFLKMDSEIWYIADAGIDNLPLATARAALLAVMYPEG